MMYKDRNLYRSFEQRALKKGYNMFIDTSFLVNNEIQLILEKTMPGDKELIFTKYTLPTLDTLSIQ